MDRINILNKSGFLTNEDRKEPLEHGCDFFTFKTNLELSEPIKVTPYGGYTEYSINQYSRDVASFICFWEHFVKKDLNGFPGFHNVKFELIGFKIIN